MLKKEKILRDYRDEQDFLDTALTLFNYQYQHNAIYRSWTDALHVRPGEVQSLDDLPFLPVEFFKSQRVLSVPAADDVLCFTSSATTSQVPARHYVPDLSWYEAAFTMCFQRTYGSPGQYCILALLPNYLQRGGSSLVYMCAELIRRSGHPLSGFFLDDTPALLNTIAELQSSGQPCLLIGVSYALIDLCDKGLRLGDRFIVMETGGMKGRRREMLKPELHSYLKQGLGVSTVHSEYGMTELLSQGYSTGDLLFRFPPWMRALTREVDDPLKLRHDGRTGGINIIDLSNIQSCCFLATKDLGRLLPDGALELMGRYDNSDVRGCNLMLEP